MFSVCFYWCISCSVIISYLLTAVFDARLMRLNKSVIHSSFIQSMHTAEREQASVRQSLGQS